MAKQEKVNGGVPLSLEGRVVNTLNSMTSFLEGLSERKKKIIRSILWLLLSGSLAIGTFKMYMDNDVQEVHRNETLLGIGGVQEARSEDYEKISTDNIEDYPYRISIINLSDDFVVAINPKALILASSELAKRLENEDPSIPRHLFFIRDLLPVGISLDSANDNEVIKRASGYYGVIKVAETFVLERNIETIENIFKQDNNRELRGPEKLAIARFLECQMSAELLTNLQFSFFTQIGVNPTIDQQRATFHNDVLNRMVSGEIPPLFQLRMVNPEDRIPTTPTPK